MRKLIITLICAICLSCGGNTTTQSDPLVPSVITPKAKRTDLPKSWNEISGDGWSFGLPGDFKPNDIVPADLFAQYKSQSRGLTIEFSAVKTTQDLHTFVTNKILLNKEIMVLQIAEKTQARLPILAVHSLAMPTSPVFKTKNASLDFFVKKNDTVYQLSCYSANNTTLQLQSKTCFNIIDTLLIQ